MKGKGALSGLLFLDFDGVMNTPDWCRAKAVGLATGQRVTEFTPKAIRELNRILRNCDLRLVVSSSWRLDAKMDLQKIWRPTGWTKRGGGIWARPRIKAGKMDCHGWEQRAAKKLRRG